MGGPATRDTLPGRGNRRGSASADDLAAGTLLGEYQIESRLASGGCGTVYAARHRLLARPVAIKVLHRHLVTSAEMVERFVREARAVNRIGHAGIVDIHDFGELDDGRPYYVMELIEGAVDLGRLVAEHGRYSPAEALELLGPVCDALHAAHEAGIVHRDLKAGNVIVVDRAGSRIIKLHDFGIAKLLDPAGDEAGLTGTNERLGTPHAMAPEQVRGQPIDRRTDIYAMGVLIYHLLTGRYPFEAPRAEEIEWLHVTAAPPPPSESAPVSAAVDAVVLRCLAKAPADRFADVLELLAAFRAAVERDDRRARGGRRAGRAVAVLVDARLSAGGLDAGDAVLDRLDDLLADAAGRLAAAGFPPPLRMSSSVLAARELVVGADGAAACAAALAAAHDICAALPAAGPDLHVNVCIHVDAALLHESGQGSEVVGGPIAQVTAWAPAGQLHGVCATTAALTELPEVTHEPAAAGLVRLRPRAG